MSVVDALLARPVRPTAREPAPESAPRVCLVGCSDPAHTAQLEALAPPGAVVLRAPGPILATDGELTRAVASAVLLHGCAEILVLAHSNCSLTSTDTGTALAAVTRAGLPRSAIPGDVRAFFNLHASPRQLALDTARALRALGCLPPRTLVHALLLDESTGELCVVERGENAERRTLSEATVAPDSTFGAPLPDGLGVGLVATLGNPTGPVDMGPGANVEMVALGSSLDALPRMEIGIAEPVALRPAATMEEGLAAIAGVPTPIPLTQAEKPTQPPPPVPPRKRAGAGSPSKRPQPDGTAARLALHPALRGNLERVREFYRVEIELQSRREIAMALQRAAAAGATNPELLRIVLKPVLDLGPKRYKVLDELLAVKQAGLEMSRGDLQQVLRQILD